MDKNYVSVLLLIPFITCCYCFPSNMNTNSIDKFFINNKCNLPYKIQEEIRGYQKTVNRIVDEIVNGKYAGDTYRRFVCLFDFFFLT